MGSMKARETANVQGSMRKPGCMPDESAYDWDVTVKLS